MTPDRRTLLAIFSFAFGVRILYAVLFGGDPAVIPVHETYDFRIAAQMAAGWGWLTTPFSPIAPGYLIALSLVFRAVGASWWAAVMFNTILGAITAMFLYRIGEQRLGRRVGLASALWLGACVSQIHYASLAIRDVMVTFLLVWLAYTLVRPFYRMRTAVWAGFLYLLLVYTEPMFLLALPVIVVFLGLKATHHRALSLQYLFLFVATVFVLAVPWTIRNYVVYREYIPVSLKAQRYTSFVYTREKPADAEHAVRKPGFLQNTADYWRVARFEESPGNPSVGIRPEPAWSLRHNTATLLNIGILLPFFVAGVGFALKKRKRSALVLSGVVICHALLRGWLGGSDEARLPVEPFIILLGFYGMRELLDLRAKNGHTQEEGAA